jgi:methyl-accepting chemotaxis protein
MTNWNHETIMTVFVVLAGTAMVVQAIVLVALAIVARKAAKQINEAISDMRDSVVPALNTSRDILDKIAPKIEPLTADLVRTAAFIKIASSDLAEISNKLRIQSTEVQVAAAEVVDRARKQAGRVDAMVTSVLDATDRAAAFVQTAVSVPARQASGILAAAKAVVESLRNGEHAAKPDYRYTNSSRDKDQFI